MSCCCRPVRRLFETSTPTTLSSLTYAAAPGDDAPELARLGPYRVGVKTLSFTYPDQPDIGEMNMLTRNAPIYDRTLEVDVIYPADVAADVESDAVYPGYYVTGPRDVQGLPTQFSIEGIAVRDATPLAGQKFSPGAGLPWAGQYAGRVERPDRKPGNKGLRGRGDRSR